MIAPTAAIRRGVIALACRSYGQSCGARVQSRLAMTPSLERREHGSQAARSRSLWIVTCPILTPP
jgi:hypothetical protein